MSGSYYLEALTVRLTVLWNTFPQFPEDTQTRTNPTEPESRQLFAAFRGLGLSSYCSLFQTVATDGKVPLEAKSRAFLGLLAHFSLLLQTWRPWVLFSFILILRPDVSIRLADLFLLSRECGVLCLAPSPSRLSGPCWVIVFCGHFVTLFSHYIPQNENKAKCLIK